jgi:hypothetical protein
VGHAPGNGRDVRFDAPGPNRRLRPSQPDNHRIRTCRTGRPALFDTYVRTPGEARRFKSHRPNKRRRCIRTRPRNAQPDRLGTRTIAAKIAASTAASVSPRNRHHVRAIKTIPEPWDNSVVPVHGNQNHVPLCGTIAVARRADRSGSRPTASSFAHAAAGLAGRRERCREWAPHTIVPPSDWPWPRRS